MRTLLLQIGVLILIFIGEALSVYAELLGAHQFVIGGRAFSSTYLHMFLVIVIAGGFLIAGYLLGFLAYKNIWIMSAISLCSILVVETFLSFTLFHQWPTRGALIGLIFGVIGLIWAMVDTAPVH